VFLKILQIGTLGPMAWIIIEETKIMAIRLNPVGEMNLHGKNLALSQAVRKMNLLGLMALSDVFSFWVNSILQGSSNAQSLLCGEVDVLFDIPLIGLFKAVRFERNSFHEAILLLKNAVSSRKAGCWQSAGVFFNRG
ncbi:uncharacterized protein METZ01_LOCUS414262, partial [marine metagenome]